MTPVVFTFLILVCLSSTAQTGNVSLHQDLRLTSLYERSLSKADSVVDYQWQNVYRIVVCSSQDRQKIFQLKARLMSTYPNSDVFVAYQSPFFKLKLGDFLTQIEAETFEKAFTLKFKLQTYIVLDKRLTRFKM